jgi:hypothetical protein
MSKKDHQNERYSVIAITLHYIDALSNNTSTLFRKVIAFDSFDSYHCRHMEIVIDSNSYRSLWAHGKHYHFL